MGSSQTNFFSKLKYGFRSSIHLTRLDELDFGNYFRFGCQPLSFSCTVFILHQIHNRVIVYPINSPLFRLFLYANVLLICSASFLHQTRGISYPDSVLTEHLFSWVYYHLVRPEICSFLNPCCLRQSVPHHWFRQLFVASTFQIAR